MAQRESRLSRDIMKKARLRGAFCFKVHGSEYMMAGLPDIIMCYRGQFIGLETKLPGKEANTSPRQEWVHLQIQGPIAQGIAMVITGWNQVEALLDALDEHYPQASLNQSLLMRLTD